ncbi:MAG TPA: hypothetical protein VFD90_03070 [Gaiellales bacterium]|jgi:hypothetical protein|nr:hypothetical protein [Gaiellales bacterium]
MSSADDTVWYELRPNGHPQVAVWNPKRYRTQAEAEQAARELRDRMPDFKFIDIVSCHMEGRDTSRPTQVGRVQGRD